MKTCIIELYLQCQVKKCQALKSLFVSFFWKFMVVESSCLFMKSVGCRSNLDSSLHPESTSRQSITFTGRCRLTEGSTFKLQEKVPRHASCLCLPVNGYISTQPDGRQEMCVWHNSKQKVRTLKSLKPAGFTLKVHMEKSKLVTTDTCW